MAIRALLTLNGKEYEIKCFKQTFIQYINPLDNRPNFQVQFGHLEFKLSTPENNDIMELMLPVRYSLDIEGELEIWDGKDMPRRRIKFTKGIIIYYRETFDLSNADGMLIHFIVAAWQMEINKFPMLRYDLGFPWVKVDWEEPKPLLEKTYAPPIPLVRKVKIEEENKYLHYLAGDKITLKVIAYNISQITEQEKGNIRWQAEVDGKMEDTPMKTEQGFYQGDSISFYLPKRWVGKNIRIMPYLKKPNSNISVQISVDNLIDVYTNNEKYLFSLYPNEIHQTQRLKAKELYQKGIQWFSPSADNYLKLALLSKDLFKAKELKHFSWEEIVAFGEVDRTMLAYRTGGSGDWKASGKLGGGFLLVTVDRFPYWADAIGQIPFALNNYRNNLIALVNSELAALNTIKVGKLFGDGSIFGGTSDNSNSYDNEMIQRAVEWAKMRYVVSGINKWNRNAIIKTRDHSPSLLAIPTK